MHGEAPGRRGALIPGATIAESHLADAGLHPPDLPDMRAGGTRRLGGRGIRRRPRRSCRPAHPRCRDASGSRPSGSPRAAAPRPGPAKGRPSARRRTQVSISIAPSPDGRSHSAAIPTIMEPQVRRSSVASARRPCSCDLHRGRAAHCPCSVLRTWRRTAAELSGHRLRRGLGHAPEQITIVLVAIQA